MNRAVLVSKVGRLGSAVATGGVATLLLALPLQAGLIGSGNAGRCQLLDGEATTVCAGEGKDRTCVTNDTRCGGPGNDGSCSCEPGCDATGDCCADYQPVCAGNFQCIPDSGQIVFLHVEGMCSTHWASPYVPGRLADVSGVPDAVSVDVHAVQTDATGIAVAAKTLSRYLDACCTGSNSCIIYNFSNGDNVVGFALDQLATTTEVCTDKGKDKDKDKDKGKDKGKHKGHDKEKHKTKHKKCETSLAWNILEVRTSGGNGGGSELADWGSVADLFACHLAPHIGPTEVRSLYDHNNTRGVPVFHMGGFLDQTTGSDYVLLNLSWWFLPWHNEGAVGYHSSGARNDSVEWCGDGNHLEWDWDYLGYWCTDEDLCSSNYGTLFQGHTIAFCPMLIENSDHVDQKMAFIEYQGQ